MIATFTQKEAASNPERFRDQGTEMARHKQFSMATDMAVYFCDAASAWQRGTDQNTNGLLRQSFPDRLTSSVATTPRKPRSSGSSWWSRRYQ
jgi:transposase, IS30 family